MKAKSVKENRRTSNYVTINGETKILTRWLGQYGVSKGMYSHRIKKLKMEPFAALTMPKLRKRNVKKLK